jgi:hypothetical protein
MIDPLWFQSESALAMFAKHSNEISVKNLAKAISQFMLRSTHFSLSISTLRGRFRNSTLLDRFFHILPSEQLRCFLLEVPLCAVHI